MIDGHESETSGLSYDGFSAFDQDVGGEINVEGSTATLHGNAWKVFELGDLHEVTENTRLRFDFRLVTEAEGHAICVLREGGLSEDPFFGQNVHCVLVAGTQFNAWSHVKKINLARLGLGVSQSYNENVGAANKAINAVDGNRNTYTNTKSQSHFPEDGTVFTTDFHVVIQAGYLVTEVKIYNRLDSFKSRFDNFKVYVRIGTDGDFLCEKDLDQTNVDESGLIQVTDIDVCIEENGRLSSIPIADAASNLLTVGISLLGQTTVMRDGEEVTVAYPHMIGEFEVYGKPIVHTGEGTTSFDIHVADLLPESDSHIQYIAFIQDNDFDIYSGESSFSNIAFEEDSSSGGGSNTLTIQHETVEVPDQNQHSDFGSYHADDERIPASGDSWDTQNTPERTDTWELQDETEDPKDFCYYNQIKTYGYNAHNPSHTNMNNFWKSLGTTNISPDRATYFNPTEFHEDDNYPPLCTGRLIPRVNEGPRFEFTSRKCNVDTIYSRSANDNSRTKPLLRCQGHCRHDDDCADGLYCYFRDFRNHADQPSGVSLFFIFSKQINLQFLCLNCFDLIFLQ